MIGLGNLFLDITIDLFRGPIPYFAILTHIAYMNNIPIMLYGISIGPLTTSYGKMLTRGILKEADIITVRDKQSIEEARKLGFKTNNIRLLPDPVTGVEFKVNEFRRKKVVAISVRNIASTWNKSLSDNYIKSIIQICDYIIDVLDYNIVFVPQCTYKHGGDFQNDIIISNEIISELNNSKNAVCLRDGMVINQVLDVYSKCEFAISTRLHSCIFASIVNTPVIAINYNPKVRGFIKWIKQEKYCVDIDNINFDILKDLIVLLKRNYDREKINIKSSINECKNNDQDYVKYALKLIKKED